MKPSARSTKYLRDRGFIVCKVEQRLPIPGMFVTRDAFNFGDLLIAKPGWGVALLQETSAAHMSEREGKIHSNPQSAVWLASGGRILIHGWSKKGPRGKMKRWTLNEREVLCTAVRAAIPK